MFFLGEGNRFGHARAAGFSDRPVNCVAGGQQKRGAWSPRRSRRNAKKSYTVVLITQLWAGRETAGRKGRKKKRTAVLDRADRAETRSRVCAGGVQQGREMVAKVVVCHLLWPLFRRWADGAGESFERAKCSLCMFVVHVFC